MSSEILHGIFNFGLFLNFFDSTLVETNDVNKNYDEKLKKVN